MKPRCNVFWWIPKKCFIATPPQNKFSVKRSCTFGKTPSEAEKKYFKKEQNAKP